MLWIGDKWKEDNPDWSRDYSDPSTVPGVGEVGDWQDKLNKNILVGKRLLKNQKNPLEFKVD